LLYITKQLLKNYKNTPDYFAFISQNLDRIRDRQAKPKRMGNPQDGQDPWGANSETGHKLDGGRERGI
jgi:hypothetical protein